MAVRDTSVEAYFEIIESGKALNQRQRVFRGIHQYPGRTRQELSHLLNIPINAICGRVNELLKSGVVVEGQRKTCPFSGKNAYSLYIVQPTHKNNQYQLPL